MSVTQKLRELLDRQGVKFVVVTHSPAYTAQEIAASMRTPEREMAKTFAEAIRMSFEDYRRLAQPKVGRFAEQPVRAR
jgi:hypothetical protein